MSTLNSFDIAQELSRLGYALKVKNKHANGYEHPDWKGRVYVKMSKTGAPVGRQPFLIHPDHLGSPLWSEIKALSPTEPNALYKNADMTGFPKGMGSGSNRAVALDVSDPADLHQILALIGHTGLASKTSLLMEMKQIELFNSMLSDSGVTDTEREALIKARIGQGDYRKALLVYWAGCAVTGCANPELLRASHIKPWRAASAAERLDPYNGLLLTPNLDLAFDQGLISFDDNGQILLGSDLDPDSAHALNLHPHLRLRQIGARHQGYLAWHRDNLFRK